MPYEPHPSQKASAAEGLRFLIAGGLNTAVGYGLYLLMLPWIRYEIAYAIAYVLGIGTSYLLNATFVFRQPLSLKAAFAFPLVYAAQLILGSVLLKVLVDWMGIPKQFAPLIVVVLSLPITFLLSRRIVSGKSNSTQAETRDRNSS